MIAPIHGIHLAYNDRGTGVPILFLHAFPLNRRMWEPQEQALSRDFRVITPDLRGHGESEAPLWHYTLDQFADDVAALLDHLRINEAVLAGLSMGGYTLFAFYRKFPERVKGLIFADTRAEADQPTQVAWRFALAQRVYQEGAQVVADELGPKLLCSATVEKNAGLVQQVRHMMCSTPVSGIVGDLMAIAERPDSTPLLPTILCPTLVLVGDSDILTTPADNQRIADGITGARFQIIPAAGHLSNLEQPEMFNRTVATFVNEIG
ncbi:MAG: alpha/beta fold hydrolase [Nitrospiraceae bacterium]